MTLELGRMAVWLAGVMAAGFLLISSSAQAHVSHFGEALATPAAFETSTTQAVDPSMPADDQSSQDSDLRISAIGTGPDNECPNVETSCCGIGISSCSSATLVQALPALRLPKSIVVDASLGSPSLTGTSVDRLIRPPRAAV